MGEFEIIAICAVAVDTSVQYSFASRLPTAAGLKTRARRRMRIEISDFVYFFLDWLFASRVYIYIACRCFCCRFGNCFERDGVRCRCSVETVIRGALVSSAFCNIFGILKCGTAQGGFRSFECRLLSHLHVSGEINYIFGSFQCYATYYFYNN